MPDVTDFLNQFSDPRAENKVTYPLSSLLFMSICSVCSGAETWGQIITWSETHKAWLNNYVDMSQGIPSYSTIRRLFTLIKPADFQLLLRGIVDSHHPVRKPEDHVAIDGKTLRGSHCHAKIVTAMQMVSAFSVENRLTLSEVKTNSKSNEITAIPVLLALLELEGATVSIDAIGCNDTVINAILAQDADYIVGLKRNQPSLYQAVLNYASEKGNKINTLVSDSFDDGHGRCIRRRYFTFALPDSICAKGPAKLKTCVAVESIVSQQHSPKVNANWRYYITDHDASHPGLPGYVRKH
ncbi:ISAs1 family transposase [Candidatus Regiella insecticola]|nr:ISAs1 family transposase [Candidatus Regiella insecticola]GFN46680.1 transposase IS4 family protein [Candidatus Regiella insecticola]